MVVDWAEDRMRYAVTTGAAGIELGPVALAALAAEAEAAGWNGFFLEDYLVYQGRGEIETFDPWVCLAAMAAATTRIRLGLTVVPLPRRRPWVVAAQAVAIDHLSGGRLILGVGSGDPDEPDFAATGDAATTRELAERLDGLAIINALWSGDPVTFVGRHYQLDGLHWPPGRSSGRGSRSGSAALSLSHRYAVEWLIGMGPAPSIEAPTGTRYRPTTYGACSVKRAIREMPPGRSTSRSAAAMTGS